MRLQQLALRVSGDGQKLRFHERLTVIGGIGVEDRQGVVEVVLGTLAGEPTVPSELAYVGRAGQRVTVDQTAEGTFHTFHDDGTAGVPPSLYLGLSVRELFDLMYLDGRQLGILPLGTSEPRDLAEARVALVALNDQLGTAQMARDATEAFRVELFSIEEQIRQIDAGRPRRHYARMLLQLERLKAERAALTATADEAAIDGALVSNLGILQPVAERWREASRRVASATAEFGQRVRLDRHTMAGAMSIPERAPLHLDALVEELAAAEAQRATLSGRLASLLAPHLPGPIHPDVARLARGNQDRVWKLAARAVETSQQLEKESIALGGLVPEGETPALVQEIESAHAAVEQAAEVLEKRRMGVVAAGGAAALGAMALPLAPLVAPLALAGSAAAAYWSLLVPRQHLADAQDWETDALIRAGVPSYLTFHLRRVEALTDPSLREGLERAASEHRAAMAEWRTVAGDMSPFDAVDREAEVRRHADAVAALGDLGPEVNETRQRLTEEVEPAVERAREALMEVCRPFGIEHPTLAADLVRQLTEVARVARLQAALEAAEDDERRTRKMVEDLLVRMGSPADDDLPSRLAAYEQRAAQAEERVRDRSLGRSVQEVTAEIERLDELAHTQYRPEFGNAFTAVDAEEPDREELESRRDMTAAAYHMANQLVPDVVRIADRRSAVERRVALLEERYGKAQATGASRVAEVGQFLTERLSRLLECGNEGESLPLVLDDAFLHLPADEKWTMLDLIDRLSSQCQIVYLSEDSEAATWARRRATTGTISFLEPLRQPVG